MTTNTVSDLERVVATEAIRNLKARYFRDLDTKDWRDLPHIFTPDALFDLRWVNSVRDPISGIWTPPPGGDAQIFRGREIIVAMIRTAIENLRTVHRAYVPEIEVLTPSTARGIWPMEDVLRHASGELLLNGFGHYHETYEASAAGWQVKTSRLTRLSMLGGALEVK
jgi:SnoaL-like domain